MKNLIKLTIALAVMFAASNAFAAAKYASIGVNEGNVRKCASTKCGIKFKVWKYTPVEMLSVSKDKNWVEVKDFEGFTGWVHKDLLSETPGMSAKVDANIRTSPSSTATVAWVVEKGYSLKFIKKQGSWLNVSDDSGVTGWINASVVWGFLEYKK
ncbi:MAG: SH3 domain-containing protein [Elusimicrobiota bacterium]|jgi:N-acetylmuramoyl-L-alanine amidase|nr:SH3 domain-containing protein [Elusimicrobiota bacterium]